MEIMFTVYCMDQAEIEAHLISHGSIEVQGGVYISTSAHMISEQLQWDDDDGQKNTDFSCNAFWIATDNGFMEGFNSIEEAMRTIDN